MQALLQILEVTVQLLTLFTGLMEPILHVYNGMDIVSEALTSNPLFSWECPTIEDPLGGSWICDDSVINCTLHCDQCRQAGQQYSHTQTSAATMYYV